MLVILSVFLIIFQSSTLSSQFEFDNYQCDNTYGNYTANSTYQQNLNTLFSDISSNTNITYGFYNFSSGKFPDIVYGIGLCRGDISLDECHTCLKNTTALLLALCTNQKQAIGWYGCCTIRYSNQSMFGVMETAPLYWIRNKYPTLDQTDFNRVLSDLFGGLLSKTSAGNSTLKYAMNMANVSNFVTIYAFTQCTPDLSQSDCYTCLSDSISYLPTCCPSYQGVRFFRPSCNLRYEVYKFSNAFDTLALPKPSEAPSSPPPTLSPPNLIPGKVAGKGGTRSKIVVVVVAIIFVCLFLGGVVYLCLRRDRRKWKKANNVLEEEDGISSIETLQFAYGDIKDATYNFSEASKLGRGGFGTVYKGVLTSGKEIVKRLARNSTQGEEEFRTEVLLVANLRHRNLVKLLGYSLEGAERLLVYEFLPNASLDHFLFGISSHVSLDWDARYNIIGGIARGLLYLHEDSRIRIIHRDLKASNILLDALLNPRIADFGMARGLLC